MSVLWGISFDATPISGLVVEFVKTASVFRDRGYRVHLDLGYDIKADKNAFFRPYREESSALPDWVRLDRPDLAGIEGYHGGFVAAVLREVVGAGRTELLPRVEALAERVADRIVAAWRRAGVTFVVVENGTLPENITYTKALYRAIERYGREAGLGRFVLWRDHDLMWQSEPGTGKYGSDPYPHAVQPVDSPHIQYVALHDEARRKTLSWARGLHDIAVLPNTFDHSPTRRNPGFREHFGIPADAPLIARCTRVIPQKRIDRDLHLIAWLPGVHLFVAGDPAEDPVEYENLQRLASDLGVTDRVVFGGRLAPREVRTGRAYSIRDLLAEATLASFLTSYDYESYGNPIGEAIASKVPYLTSDYELYHTVYGHLGFQAPMLTTDRPDRSFVDSVAELLLDEGKRARMAEHNHRIGRQHFDRDQTEQLVDDMLATRTRLSVVLPVFNEAHNLPAVLDSLYAQELDKDLYEIVLVDNNSTDDTVAVARAFAAAHPDLRIHLLDEPEQGVACARKAGMDFAARHLGRAAGTRYYLVSADADCRVDRRWLPELFRTMEANKAAIGVCDYYYNPEHFTARPRLWDAIQRTLRCRAVTFALFGGFPDGKGFAVDRDVYEKVGGIEIFYQLHNGRFVNHLSDDWDFGIRVRGSGEDIVYAPTSRVEINPRRVDHAIDEVITGRAYGNDGIIVMRDIRPERPSTRDVDLTEAEALQAWEFSIKDFTPKNTILPLLLTPSLLDSADVIEFFGPDLAQRLHARIEEIADEMRVVDFTPIHVYKTPSYRLYFEFADEIFARLRASVGEDIGYPPPLPAAFDEVPPQRFREFVRYYCEDRESGEAHNYFGNGGVF
ncbi:glycosyltransferase [Kutzneria kofuensis]|uniref:Glycosyltransferase involved in cell wall biosynthesis n=1 Tax=Kutzneria kofuensis TaxID=103725 RepID=A0A7W9NK01_9PSEU|nr:glycosyltransferase [Kutzneria kofuensis]MBB5895475.1 glycosyltransferase involved in cell wall biosynthesis [Kutzneria kofuensis]